MQANPWTECEQVHKRLRTIYEKIEKNKTTTTKKCDPTKSDLTNSIFKTFG